MTTFSPGDRVQLKSGSPLMTVEKVDDDQVACVWREGDKKNVSFSRETFLAVTLVAANPTRPVTGVRPTTRRYL